jgi:hypothetical protein
MTALGFEARNGSPSGRLSAESAGEFLAHHLIHCYSSMSAPPPRCSGGLPGNRLKVILEYIEVNLAQPLSLHELARLSGVSPRHFERAFRQATGEVLHAHVLRIRVLAARGSFAEWARPHHRRDFRYSGANGTKLYAIGRNPVILRSECLFRCVFRSPAQLRQ